MPPTVFFLGLFLCAWAPALATTLGVGGQGLGASCWRPGEAAWAAPGSAGQKRPPAASRQPPAPAATGRSPFHKVATVRSPFRQGAIGRSPFHQVATVRPLRPTVRPLRPTARPPLDLADRPRASASATGRPPLDLADRPRASASATARPPAPPASNRPPPNRRRQVENSRAAVEVETEAGLYFLAKSVLRSAKGDYFLNDYQITTCPEEVRLGWSFQGGQARWDRAKQTLYLQKSKFKLFGATVFKIGKYWLPTDGRGRSGLLVPKIDRGDLGTEIAVPFYWRPKSNFELTLAPRLTEKLGAGAEVGLGHLTRSSKLRLAALYQDSGEAEQGLSQSLPARDLWLASAAGGARTGDWRLQYSLARTNYPDLGRRLETAALARQDAEYLPSLFSLVWQKSFAKTSLAGQKNRRTGYLSAEVRSIYLQDLTSARKASESEDWRLTLSGALNLAPFALGFSASAGSYAIAKRPELASERSNLKAYASYSGRYRGGWFLRTGLRAEALAVTPAPGPALEKSDELAAVNFEFKAGLDLISAKGHRLRPQLLATWSGMAQSRALLTLDSAQASFDYDQLWRRRFSLGDDYIGDPRRLTAGIAGFGPRGQGTLSWGLAIIKTFAPSYLYSSGPADGLSPIPATGRAAAKFAYSRAPNTAKGLGLAEIELYGGGGKPSSGLRLRLRFDFPNATPKAAQSGANSLGLSYRRRYFLADPAPDQAGYLDQFEVYGDFQFGSKWQLLAAYNYLPKAGAKLAASLAVQYHNCCLALTFSYREAALSLAARPESAGHPPEILDSARLSLQLTLLTQSGKRPGLQKFSAVDPASWRAGNPFGP